MIRLFIESSNFRREVIVVAVPRHEIADPFFDRSLRPEAGIARQIVDIGIGSMISPGCIGNICFTASRPNSFSSTATTCRSCSG